MRPTASSPLSDFSINLRDSAVIGSNLEYAAIHQLGGQAGRNKAVEIPARPYLFLTDSDYDEIKHEIKNYLKDE